MSDRIGPKTVDCKQHKEQQWESRDEHIWKRGCGKWYITTRVGKAFLLPAGPGTFFPNLPGALTFAWIVATVENSLLVTTYFLRQFSPTTSVRILTGPAHTSQELLPKTGSHLFFHKTADSLSAGPDHCNKHFETAPAWQWAHRSPLHNRIYFF